MAYPPLLKRATVSDIRPGNVDSSEVGAVSDADDPLRAGAMTDGMIWLLRDRFQPSYHRSGYVTGASNATYC
ncbi:MAG: hypothetical protein ACLR20_08115 [Bifidobacterium longum]